MSDEPPRKKMALDLSKFIPETTTEVKEIIKMQAGITSKESQEFKKLEKVLEFLVLSELKTCRMVCKLWNEVASSVMIKQDRCQISIEYFRVGKCKNTKTKMTQTTIAIHQKVHNRNYGHHSLHSDYQIKEEKSLTELIKCIKNSVKFPCASFGFSFCDMSAENVMNFFDVIGQQIKTLCLHESSYGSIRTPLNAFRSILQVRAPNVQKLQVNNFRYKWTDDDNLSLPSLTHLILETCYWNTSDAQTIKRILEGANNLKFVDGFPLCLNDMFVETEKIQVIKSFTCRSQLSQEESIDLAAFANSKPCLRFFSFGCERKSSLKCLEMQAKLATSFSSILECSKDALRELKVGDWYYMSKEKIPRLQNLKELSIVNTRSPIWDGTFFPPGVNVGHSFPNIVYLCLELIELKDNRWIANIPITRNFIGQLTTVKTLKISKLWDMEWLKALHDMCPNFENLIVTSSSTPFVQWNSSSDFFTKICGLWPHLKGLELVVTEEDAEMPNFDPILTGLSWQDCKILTPNRNSRETQMMPEYEEMKRNQSILDLKDLRTFKLLFDLKTDEEWSSRKRLSAPWDTMSIISVVYGFNLIPGLKVTIGWDHGQDAYGGMNINSKELSQFVNFIHWSNLSAL